jgi:hypothetical protein
MIIGKRAEQIANNSLTYIQINLEDDKILTPLDIA